MRFRLSIFSLIACSGFLLAASLTLADSPGYRFDSWTSGSGLPQNSVYSILQTADGYLWLTTLDGLVRYDGVRFKVFNKLNTAGIASNRFTKLFEDRDKNLWICTENGGLTRYRAGAFTTFTTKDGLPSNWITDLQQNDSGELLVRSGKGIARWQTGRFVFVSPDSDLNYFNSTLGYQDHSGALWYKRGTMLRRVKAGAVVEYTVSDDSRVRSYQEPLYNDSQGRLWAGTSQRELFMVKDGTLTRYSSKEGLPGYLISGFCEDKSGAIWMGTLGGGLVRFQAGRFETFTTAEGLPSNNLMTVFNDHEGTLWAGTNDHGLVRITKKLINAYLPPVSYNKSLYAMIEDHAGNLWIGSNSLTRFSQGVFFPLGRLTEGLGPYPIIRGLYEDRDGRIWIGARDKLISYQNNTFTDETAALGLPGDLVRLNAILRDRQGRLWLGTRNGLFEHQKEKNRLYTQADGLPEAEISCLLEDQQGRLWLGTSGGLVRFQNGQFTTYAKREGLSSEQVRSLYEDREGVLWIGTYDGGLNRFKDGRFTRYTTADGLFSNGVFQILEDDAGNLWMSSNQGIYRVSRTVLNEFAAGAIGQITSISYGIKDGMLNAECNGGRQPAGIRTRDGRLWFPTVAGIVSIDPNEVTFNPLPPPVLIEEVLLNRKTIPFRHGLEIPAGQQNLELRYTGLSFLRPEAVSFRYQIEGLDAGWVEAGNQRAALYPYLPAGNYTFRVSAANADGVWNQTGAALRLVVIPPFYQTWWFQSLLIVAFLGIVGLIYRWRVERLKRARLAQEAFSRRLVASQEAERKRIAAELHDSLGQSLLVIKNRAYLGSKKTEDQQATLKQFDQITSAVSHALEEVRGIAHALRPLHLERLGLTAAIESIINNVASSSEIKLTAQLDSLDGLFTPEAEINLYRIVQEGVNNILKHSGATEARVEIKRTPGGVSIRIQDNGKGFLAGAESGTEQHAHASARRGFGLLGLAERARMLGGKCTITSAPDKGTLLFITAGLENQAEGGRDAARNAR